MTDWEYRVAIIVSADQLDSARRLSWALGHVQSPTSGFRAQLSADGSEPATAYGLSTAARPEFVALFGITATADLPAIPWTDFGLDEATVMDVLAHLQGPPQRYAMTLSATASPAQQFAELAAALGLQRIYSTAGAPS